MKNNNKIQTNCPNESIHLSLVIASTLFLQRPKPYKEDIIEEGLLKRTDYEKISFTSQSLDLYWDFPLFSIVVSKFQREKTNSFLLNEFEIYTSIKTPKDRIPLKRLRKKFDKLKNSEITIEITNNGETEIYTANLIEDWKWDDKEKYFMFQMNDIFSSFFIKNAQYERIYADKYKSLGKGYASGLYLYLETMKFKNNRWVKFNEKKKLLKRFGNNIKGNSARNRKLSEALETLKKKDVIYEYFRFKSKIDGYPICKIYRDKDSFILDYAERNKEKIKENYALLEDENMKRIKDHNEHEDIIIPIPPEFAKPLNFEEPLQGGLDHPF